MVAVVLRLIFGDKIVQGGCDKREETIVLAHDTVCQTAILPRSKVFEIDVERRQLVCTHSSDLCNVVFVCGDGARGGCTGEDWLFNKAVVASVSQKLVQ